MSVINATYSAAQLLFQFLTYVLYDVWCFVYMSVILTILLTSLVELVFLPPPRVHHYSCLLLPLSCCSELFPWERISLLIEYNLPSPNTSGLDHSTSVGDHIPLAARHTSLMKKHAHIDVHVLRGVLSNGPHTGTQSYTTHRPGKHIICILTYVHVCEDALYIHTLYVHMPVCNTQGQFIYCICVYIE